MTVTYRDVLLIEILAEVRQGGVRQQTSIELSQELAFFGRLVPRIPKNAMSLKHASK